MATQDELDDARVTAALGRLLASGTPFDQLPFLSSETQLFPETVMAALDGRYPDAASVASLETLVDTGRLSEPELTATIAAAVPESGTGFFAPLRTPTAIIFGDSRTADCSLQTSPNFYSSNLSWWHWGQARTVGGPVFDLIRNAGIGGNTTAQMLARIEADVIAYGPDYVTIWGGTNDTWATSADVDATFGRMVQMVDMLHATGIHTFLILETPVSTAKATDFNKQVIYYNDKLRAYAGTVPSVDVWDFYSQIVDPTSATGAPIAARLRDGLHLNALGTAKLAEYVAARLARFANGMCVPPTSPLDNIAGNSLSRNVGKNPLMLGTGGTLGGGGGSDSGTLPNDWASGGTPVGAFSIAPRADGYGNDIVAVVTATTTSGKGLAQTLDATKFVAGGTYVIEAGIAVESPTNLYTVALFLAITIGGTVYQFGWGPNVQAPVAGDSLTVMSGIIRSDKFTLPAGAIASPTLNVTIRHSASGTSTVRLGRVAVKRVG